MAVYERRADALIRAGLLLASELSLPAVLQKIVEIACEVAEARYGALGVLSSEGDEISEFITYGISDEERRLIGDLPRGRGILGVLITDARPLRLERIQEDPRSSGFPANHPPMTTFLGVPVSVRGRVFGNLYLTEKTGGRMFDEQDEQDVVTLAAQAAVAIENARVRAELERLALVDERERIARELHDGVVQALFAVGMSLQAAEAASTEDATKERIASAVDGIDAAIRSLRDYIFGLRPGARADTGLARELHAIAQAYDTADAPAIQAVVSDEVAALLTGRASEIALIAKEAVSNAVRHAQARRVILELTHDGTDAVLRIRDDGAGFHPDDATGEGHGMGNMAERARALGGSFTVDARSGRGTTVTVRLPLR